MGTSGTWHEDTGTQQDVAQGHQGTQRVLGTPSRNWGVKSADLGTPRRNWGVNLTYFGAPGKILG